jgi:hypothetical protein
MSPRSVGPLAQVQKRKNRNPIYLIEFEEVDAHNSFEALHHIKGSLEYHDARRYPISKRENHR